MADFAAKIGCKVLIPHHHDFNRAGDCAYIESLKDEFLRLVPDGVFISPKHGEWIDL